MLGVFHLRFGIAHVELHHLVAIHLAHILHRHLHIDLLLILLQHLGLAILKAGITQSVAKGIQRCTLEIHIGTPMTDVVIHHLWQVQDILHPRLSGSAGRVHLTHQHIHHTMSLLLRAVGHLQNCRQILVAPVDGVRETAHQH